MTALLSMIAAIALIWVWILREMHIAPEEPIYDNEDDEFDNQL
jgi:hypothetical protein